MSTGKLKIPARKVCKSEDGVVRLSEGLTWDEVAAKMKGNCTGESARKEFQRWMKEK